MAATVCRVARRPARSVRMLVTPREWPSFGIVGDQEQKTDRRREHERWPREGARFAHLDRSTCLSDYGACLILDAEGVGVAPQFRRRGERPERERSLGRSLGG